MEERLRADGLDRAAHNLFQLGEFLFGDGEATLLMEEMARYVLEGGLYGAAGRAAASELSKSGGKLAAVKKQVFRSRAEFENRYPWLKRAPFLLPVAWVLRLAGSFRKHGKHIRQWFRGLNAASIEEIAEQRERLSRFGL